MVLYKWHEQVAHKNLLKAELETLERGLGGDFKLLKLEVPSPSTSKIVAKGILSYGEGKEQAISIEFPTKYPYAPPRVFSRTLLTDDANNITEEVKLFFKGNQFNDGRLCLFRENFWNKNQHNVGWVLRRAQEWLRTADSPEGFTPDKIVEEIPLNLPHVGQVVLPKSFRPPANAKKGKMVLSQFKPNYYILEQNQVASNPFPIILSEDVFEWYAFSDDITFKALLSTTSNPVQAFLDVFKAYFNENIYQGSQLRHIAFYLPGDSMEWHFFRVGFQRVGSQFAVNQLDYLISRNVEKELYLRTKDIFDDLILKDKRVTIIGLGALGSEVAKSLARNGVGHFNLFDDDTFEIGNSVRHAADLFFIGEKKVAVVKDLILRTNPNITVNSFPIDIFYDNGLLEECLQNSDICIILTAEDSVDYFINDKFINQYQIPFVFGRVSAGGLSGAIQLVENKKSACLRCLSEQNLDRLPTPKTGVVIEELPAEYGSCSSPALPGSEVDTKEVALQVTRVSLQTLLAEYNSNYPKISGNQFYWHGPTGSKGKAPFTWEVKKIKPLPNCSICNGEHSF